MVSSHSVLVIVSPTNYFFFYPKKKLRLKNDVSRIAGKKKAKQKRRRAFVEMQFKHRNMLLAGLQHMLRINKQLVSRQGIDFLTFLSALPPQPSPRRSPEMEIT